MIPHSSIYCSLGYLISGCTSSVYKVYSLCQDDDVCTFGHYKLISFNNISITYATKDLIHVFSNNIHENDRIAIIGNNGSGKTSLLDVISQKTSPSSGYLKYTKNISTIYIPQSFQILDGYSAGESLIFQIGKAISLNPDLLILDEPTNHLDTKNIDKLNNLLSRYHGMLILATHDEKIMSQHANKIWAIENGYVNEFNGTFDAYLREKESKQSKLQNDLENLKKQKKSVHMSLMKEQERSSKSVKNGLKNKKQGKWTKMIAKEKAGQAQNSFGDKQRNLRKSREDVSTKLSELVIPETITPKFHISHNMPKNQTILHIRDGSILYDTTPILHDINISLYSTDKMALLGHNGSGKTTFLKAILQNHSVITLGQWTTPTSAQIGYIDQNYNTLLAERTVIENLVCVAPSFDDRDLRRHLNNYLFRTNEDISKKAGVLSGGEKVRLSLCLLSANVPQLLILDEPTNNLDSMTLQHLLEVLSEYPGALIIASHNLEFLSKLHINTYYQIQSNGIMALSDKPQRYSE